MTAPLNDKAEIIATLKRLVDFIQPNTSSLIVLSEGRNRYICDKEPFKKGFLDDVEKRHELTRRLRTLDRTKASILLLWYVETKSKVEIARILGLSRTHIYRLHNEAIEELVAMNAEAPRKPRSPIPCGPIRPSSSEAPLLHHRVTRRGSAI
ncbi:MAG: DUF1492 domain-containing protein [Actinobacteria bacterium]|nr:DUF1492 domain-containing protein [Actinomycetota bacterium]